MRDDIETNLTFIELVRENPCLYDHARPDYSNRNKQDKVWAEIAKQLNESVATCRERWKNIRGRYVKQMNKNPSGSAAKPKKPYYLAEHLSFLDTFIKSRPPTGNLQPLSPEIGDEHSNSTQDLSDIDESQHVTEFSRQFESIVTDTSAPSTPEPSTSAVVQSSYKRQRNKKTATISDVNTAALNYFEARKKTKDSMVSALDHNEAFLKSVLPDMKNMNETQKRNFKVGVLHLAGKILNQPVVTPPLTYNEGSSSSPLTASIQNEPSRSQEQNIHTLMLPQFSPISQTTNSPAPNCNQDKDPSSNYYDHFSQF